MIETDFRKQRDAEFLAQHELSQDELERLIENKFKRATAYYNAFRMRDDKFLEQDWSQQCEVFRKRGPVRALKTCGERAAYRMAYPYVDKKMVAYKVSWEIV